MIDRAMILLCPPTADHPFWKKVKMECTPKEGSYVVACDQCGCQCWLGPSQAKQRSKATLPTVVACYPCGLAAGVKLEVKSAGTEGHRYKESE